MGFREYKTYPRNEVGSEVTETILKRVCSANTVTKSALQSPKTAECACSAHFVTNSRL